MWMPEPDTDELCVKIVNQMMNWLKAPCEK